MVSCDMGTEKNARPPDLGLRPEQAVLVLDFGAQYAQLIARRIREARVFSEIVPGTTSCAAIAELQPAAIVLSGGPASVYSDDAPVCDPGLFELGVPVLGICYGHQLMAQALGGRVDRTGAREYGATTLRQGATSVLLEGMPPSLTVCNTDSIAEQIQRAIPEAKVVKALNTMTAALMVDPSLVEGDHDVFVCGNDAGAKAQVTELLKGGFGWKHVVDLGDLTAARGQEMFVIFWVRLYSAGGSPMFNVHVVR